MFSKIMFAGLTGLSASLLAVTGASADQGDPSDPGAQVPRVEYRPILSGYQNTPISSTPGNWRELNERMEQIGGPGGQLREPDAPLRKKTKP